MYCCNFVEILVAVLHVCVESFAAEMLAEVKVVDNYHGVAIGKWHYHNKAIFAAIFCAIFFSW